VNTFAHPLRVVMVDVRNPLNIGAAARAMSNFGFTELRLVNPYDVAFREARSAVKAQGILENAREYKTIAEAIADCSLVVGTTALGPRLLEHRMRRLEYGGKLIARRLASAPAALLFGSEKFGLSNEEMSYCHWLMRIPTRDEHGSMNLGQAVAVCLYEMIRDPKAATLKPEPQRAADGEDVERLTGLLDEVLSKSGYVHKVTEESTELKLRRLTRRMNLNAHDVKVWMGMVRQILWKLNS
jgi:TrmH family RNA methyltransferase